MASRRRKRLREDAGSHRVLQLIGSLAPAIGGPAEVVHQLARLLGEQNIEMEVATLDQPGADFLAALPFQSHALGRPAGTDRWAQTMLPWVRYRYSADYPQWLKANLHRFSAVIVHGLWTYTTMGAVGPLLKDRTPYVVFTHGALDPWFQRAYPLKHSVKQLVWWASDGRLLNGARHVLFTTEEEKHLARNAFVPYAVDERVVGYGVPDPPAANAQQAEAFARSVPGVKGQRYLLYLSRIHPKKGCDLLVRAFACIAASDPDLHLVIAGPDETNWRPALVRMAEAAGVADRIHWPGMLKGEAKWGAFRGCEAFILPSHQENFGIVVAEALACGKPTIISDRVNIWREIESFGAGIVRPDTLEGTEAALRAWAAQTPAEKQAMGAAARTCFVECFDIKKTSADIVSLVRDVMNHVDA
jgi:glycosyltransferase involved in cell wall biosynthesis